MADVRPFRGVMYDPGHVTPDRVLCPPYDVINPRQQAAYYERDPHNAVRIVLNHGEGAARYTAAAASLREWLREGVLRQEAEPAFFVHRHRFTGPGGAEMVRDGVMAAVRLEPWAAGAVLPHEHTMPGPKQDRLDLMRATESDTEPIWVFNPDPGGEVASAIAAAIADRAPDLDAAFTAEPAGAEMPAAERHQLWRVADAANVAALGAALGRALLYIADGHHRYETGLARAAEAGGPADAATRFKLVLITPMEQPGLLVLPTHRLVRVPAGGSLGRLLAGLRDAGWRTEQPADLDGLLTRLARPAAPGNVGFGLLAEHRYSYLEGPATIGAEAVPLAPAMGDLDAAVVHQRVLAPLLGITADRLAAGETVAYSRDALEVRQHVVDGEFDLGIFLRAPSLEQVRTVADARENMPQKSTYFWPKPASGLLLLPQPPGGAL